MKNDWLNHESLKNMHPAKKQIIQEFMKESKGLPMEQSLPNLMKANNKMKSLGLSFTKQESDVIMSLLTANMSPTEMARFEMIRRMMPKF